MSRMTFAIRATDRCNLNCRYCYAKVEHPIDMSIATLEKVLKGIVDHCKGEPITISWTGGEPLLLGREFFQKIVEIEESFASQQFVNIVQSNLTLLDDWFISFFARHNFEVRTSLDLPAKHHDELRIKNNFAATLGRIKLLQSVGVPININTVLTERNVGSAQEMYQFIKEHGIRSFSVSRFIAQGNGAQNRQLAIEENEKFAHFLIELFDLWTEDKDGTVERITPLDKLIRSCEGSTIPCFHCQEQLLAIGPDGAIFPSCNKFFGFADSCFGNISTSSISEILSSELRRDFLKKVHIAVNKICSACEYVSICKGGCFYVAFAAKDDVENMTKQEFCKGYHLVFAHILKKLEAKK